MFVFTIVLLFCLYLTGGYSQDVSSNYFCADMSPQTHIDINQLTGMWFGVELINHKEDRYNLRQSPSCPIIHISHDREPLTTTNPLHRNYNYDYNYGQGYGYRNPNKPYESQPQPNQYRDQYGNIQNNNQNYRYNNGGQYSQYNRETTMSPREMRKKLRQQNEYDQRTTYSDYQLARRLSYGYDLPMPYWETKYLRLFWDENGESTEFHMRYNLTYPGFWISSGPENGGASLDPQLGHFAGTIQVIKAVGNHLVLTFCHRLPKKELYTVILSRELNLPYDEIHAVRSQLHRKGLSTRYIRRLCNDASIVKINFVFLLSTIFLLHISF